LRTGHFRTSDVTLSGDSVEHGSENRRRVALLRQVATDRKCLRRP
jgi:hypothetical protein